MQADRFTVKSQEALAAAQRLAGTRRNPEVAPEHLLLALLEQEGGIVVPVLRRAGADPERVRRLANAALDALPTVSGDASAPALGQELIGLLQRAEDEARELGDEYISTEHLLLALADAPRRRRRGAARRDRKDAARGRRARSAARTASPTRTPRTSTRRSRSTAATSPSAAADGQARPGHRPRRGDPPRRSRCSRAAPRTTPC